MADVTARSLQYEYKAVREDAEEGCGRGRPWIATNSGGKAYLGEGWIKTRRNNPSGVLGPPPPPSLLSAKPVPSTRYPQSAQHFT